MGKNLQGKELGTGIRQRSNGSYEARYQVNGLSISIYDASLTNLRKRMTIEKSAATNDISRKQKTITLDEWFYEWMETYKAPMLKDTSVRFLVRIYERTFHIKLGKVKLRSITTHDLQRKAHELSNEIALSTISKALTLLKECFDAARNFGLMEKNPAFSVLLPQRDPQRLARFLTEKEQTRFLQEVENNWYKEMFYIMFLTGMRIGELGALTWEDIDFEEKKINITKSLHIEYLDGVKTLEISTPKTSNSYRSIPFIGEAEAMFLAQKEKTDKLKAKLKNRYRINESIGDVVFVSTLGSPIIRHIAQKEINKVIHSINEKEKIQAEIENREPEIFENAYPHAFRHSFCSLCFKKNLDPKVVQALMGHKNYSTTIDIYTHLQETDVTSEVKKFGNLFE